MNLSKRDLSIYQTAAHRNLYASRVELNDAKRGEDGLARHVDPVGQAMHRKLFVASGVDLADDKHTR